MWPGLEPLLQRQKAWWRKLSLGRAKGFEACPTQTVTEVPDSGPL